MKLIILTTLLISAHLSARTLTIENKKYDAYKLGSYFYVTPQSIQTELINTNKEELENTCRKIDSILKRLKRRIQRCQSGEESGYACETIRDILDTLVTNSPNTKFENAKKWDLIVDLDYSPDFNKHAGKILNIHPNKIIKRSDFTLPETGQKDFNIKINGFSNESRYKLVKEITESSSPEITTDMYEEYIVSHNPYAMCDLRDGFIDIAINLKQEIYNTESVSSEKILQGHSAYTKLLDLKLNKEDSREIQAAYIGYEIGKALDKNSKKLIDIKELFSKLIEVKPYELKIKRFDNRSNFEEQVFPDKTYTLDIDQSLNVESSL